MSKPSDEAVRKEFEAWKKSLPKCIGYAGGCDGDLMGLEHETNCPMHGKEFASYWDALSGGFASGRSAAIQECADKVVAFTEDWRPCECGADDAEWKRRKAGKMYNTETGHAIDCPKYHALNLRDALLALKER